MGVDSQEGRKLANTYGSGSETGWKLRMAQREKPEDCDVQEARRRQCLQTGGSGHGAGGCEEVRVYSLHLEGDD